MDARGWLRAQPPQTLALWALAAACLALALAEVPLFGMDPPLLATVAAVSAALTAAVGRDTGDCASGA